MMRPVRLTLVPSTTAVASPKRAQPTLSCFEVEHEPEDTRVASPMPSNSTSSPAMAWLSPCTRAMPSPHVMTVPVSATEGAP